MFVHKLRLKTKLVDRMNKQSDVVREKFAENLVLHGGIVLASHGVAEQPLDGAKQGLHICCAGGSGANILPY